MSAELKAPIASELPQITTRNFPKLVFQAELPEQFLRSLPAQTLYLAVRGNGLNSSAELIEIASLEQCRLLIDFDCWSKWHVNEDSLWSWLALTDASDDLALLQKIVKCMDLKMVALLIARYVEYQFFDEPTDLPPGENFYTPDKGLTWISIKTEDNQKQFLIGRLLALLYETDAHLFAQLLSVASTNTESTLEEEAYQDRSRRLSSEGIPDGETSFRMNQPIAESECRDLLRRNAPHTSVVDIQPVSPLIYDHSLLQPLASLLSDISVREDFESELTYILNAAIVHHGLDFSDVESLHRLITSVKGCVNIGLEWVMKIDSRSTSEIFRVLGLQNLYRTGLDKLIPIRKAAILLQQKLSDSENINAELDFVLELASKMPPRIPLVLKDEINSVKNTDRTETLSQESAPLESLHEVAYLLEFVTQASSTILPT